MNYPSKFFFVGMPGCGKSTIGKYIARKINYVFIDLDEKIEESQELKITEIFKKKGEEYFRKIENDELKKISGKNLVISTGGGTPCFHNGIDWMNSQGLTIFLNQPLELLIQRTRDKKHRPLINQNAEVVLSKLYTERIHYYQKASIKIDSLQPFRIMTEIHSFLSERSKLKAKSR